MFHKLFFTFALAVIASLGSFQIASAQDSYHGYLIDSNAPVGTLWWTTQATTLWPNPYDVANGPVTQIPEGMPVTAVAGFRGSASGVYLKVDFYTHIGWVDHRHIRPDSTGTAQTPTPTSPTGTAQPPVPTGTAQTPPTNVSSGVTYNVVNVRNWASLRELTSSQSRRLAKVPRGAAVVTSGQQVQSGGLTWLSVSYNGVHGWMPTKYLGQGGFAAPGNNPAPVSTQGPTTNVASGTTYNVINVRNWASLRQTNSAQSRRLARVPRGAAVVTSGQQVQSGGLTWLSVSYNGVHGWMPTKYLGQGGFAAPANNPVNNGSGANGAYPVGQYRIINVNNWASLRVSPSRSAGRVTTIPRGHVVDHYGERSRAGGELWLQVVSGGFTGWMPVQYLGLN